MQEQRQLFGGGGHIERTAILNRLITQVISSMSASMRFVGNLKTDFVDPLPWHHGKIQQDLCPLFLLIALVVESHRVLWASACLVYWVALHHSVIYRVDSRTSPKHSLEFHISRRRHLFIIIINYKFNINF